jgi:predicted Zn-dependent protease
VALFKHIALGAILLVAACVKPTTDRPEYTKAELSAEAQKQKTAADAVKDRFDDKKKYTDKEIQAFAARLDAVARPVEKASTELCKELTKNKETCTYEVVFAADQKGLNAHADGKRIVMYPAMMDFATSDNDLAFVIAHEFAHNIMKHPDAAKQNIGIGALLGVAIDIAATAGGINTGGQFSQIGASQGHLSYAPEFEHEADYVGLYILARSGYPIKDAPMFWRRMSLASPQSIYISTTHPTNPARTIEMDKTVQEINYKKQRGLPLSPNIKLEKE